MEDVLLLTKNIKGFVSIHELRTVFRTIKMIHPVIKKRECPGGEFLGWLNLPSTIPQSLIKDVEDTAKRIKASSDVFLNLGIGGSYLGAKAAIEFLKPIFFNERQDKKLKIYFAGHNLSSDYLRDLLTILKGKKITINVISKSGTTTETAVVFRVIKNYLDKIYSKKEIRERIICTTDATKGALRKLAGEEGYKSFVIPDDIGGRFSVLTPVGLLPIACAGIDIRLLIKGAKDFEKKCDTLNLEENPAYKYAAIRHILYKKGKLIEILSCFHPSLHYLAEWWKQLFGESDGKKGKGIFPASCDFTTDLHSLGQIIQEGPRNMFETFLVVKKSASILRVPKFREDLDELNYLAGKDIEFINQKAYEGTALAHGEGKVPNMTIVIPKRSSYHLGQLFYFFEKAVPISGLLLGVNPFIQPGVEAYKKKMFKLLGKPKL